jgi:hypothetical protein
MKFPVCAVELSSVCKSRQAIAPAGSDRGSYGDRHARQHCLGCCDAQPEPGRGHQRRIEADAAAAGLPK